MMYNDKEVRGTAVELDRMDDYAESRESVLTDKQKEVLICVGFGAAVGAGVASMLPAVTVKFGIGLGLAVGAAVGII